MITQELQRQSKREGLKEQGSALGGQNPTVIKGQGDMGNLGDWAFFLRD